MNTVSRLKRPLAVLALVCFPALAAGERIKVDGSTGVAPLVAALAKEYQARNPGDTVEIGTGMGTKARIEALQDGRIDIAMASHGLVPADLERQGMTVHEIAKVAVVVGVNRSVTLGSIDDEQVCAIYSGRLNNWKEMGGPDLAIAPLTRPDSEVDTEVMRAGIPCLAKLQMHETVRSMAKGGDMAKGLAATPGAMGMTTMTAVEQSDSAVRALALRGIAPDPANVLGRRYPLTRDSFLVVKGSAKPAVARFIEFVRSADGARVIAENGAIALR